MRRLRAEAAEAALAIRKTPGLLVLLCLVGGEAIRLAGRCLMPIARARVPGGCPAGTDLYPQPSKATLASPYFEILKSSPLSIIPLAWSLSESRLNSNPYRLSSRSCSNRT